MKFGSAVAFSFSILMSSGNTVVAQERANTLSLEQERQATLEEFDTTELPDLDVVRAVATRLFALPLEQQDEEKLRKLSKEANRVANLIDYIYDEYNDYYREIYEYQRVREKVRVPAAEYGGIIDEFKIIRNQAYFNLGALSRDNGRTIEAFLYFKDAFRLSSFECGDGEAKTCMRWKAEQELQKLLGLSHIKAYVSRWSQ